MPFDPARLTIDEVQKAVRSFQLTETSGEPNTIPETSAENNTIDTEVLESELVGLMIQTCRKRSTWSIGSSLGCVLEEINNSSIGIR